MRVLVCGSRKWWDPSERVLTWTVLRNLYFLSRGDLCVIEGGAKGADKTASDWCQRTSMVSHEVYPANWARYGSKAGPIRNRQMLDEGRPDLVLAFTQNLRDSRGTGNMVDISREAGVPTFVFP